MAGIRELQYRDFSESILHSVNIVSTIKMSIDYVNLVSTIKMSAAPPIHETSHAPQSWPPEDDEELLRTRRLGLNWQLISSIYFPDMTANACRRRHELLMERHDSTGEWDDVEKITKIKQGLPGFANGATVSALPDTGSRKNVISASYAKKLNLKIKGSSASFELGNSKKTQSIGKFKLLALLAV